MNRADTARAIRDELTPAVGRLVPTPAASRACWLALADLCEEEGLPDWSALLRQVAEHPEADHFVLGWLHYRGAPRLHLATVGYRNACDCRAGLVREQPLVAPWLFVSSPGHLAYLVHRTAWPPGGRGDSPSLTYPRKEPRP